MDNFDSPTQNQKPLNRLIKVGVVPLNLQFSINMLIINIFESLLLNQLYINSDISFLYTILLCKENPFVLEILI